jgi:hypothetical protein
MSRAELAPQRASGNCHSSRSGEGQPSGKDPLNRKETADAVNRGVRAGEGSAEGDRLCRPADPGLGRPGRAVTD